MGGDFEVLLAAATTSTMGAVTLAGRKADLARAFMAEPSVEFADGLLKWKFTGFRSVAREFSGLFLLFGVKRRQRRF